MNEYGFQRLVLLNSAGYERAELPLDDAVSLVAPNNTGKTSLINALQFLLIIDKRRMDFGPHGAEASRRFYFPDNSAYILLEVVLPETGTVVMGCVGKGVSHDYTYFVYKGQLDVDDFRLDNGTLVQEPHLDQHFVQHDKVVYRFDAVDFTAALYGGGAGKRRKHSLDFTVFRLDYASHAAAYQRVLTRTLRLDKLKSEEVKEYLLEIFKRELPDANIDFKAEWDKAFSEVNEDRAQYKAALGLQASIQDLDSAQTRRWELRGAISHFRPLMDQKLDAWQTYFEENGKRLARELAAAQAHSSQLDQRQQSWILEQSALNQRRDAINALDQQQLDLARRFALIKGRSELEGQRDQIRQRYQHQVALVQQANQSTPPAIERRIRQAEAEIASLGLQLENLDNNLYLELAAALPETTLEQLNRVLHRDVMALPPAAFALNASVLRALSKQAGQEQELTLAGMTLRTASLQPQFSQKTRADLSAELQEQAQQLAQLQSQLQTARELEQAQQKQAQLEQALKEAEKDLDAFSHFQTLQASEAERRRELASLSQRDAELSRNLQDMQGHRDQCLAAERKTSDAIRTLEQQHATIDRLRRERPDQRPPFDYLHALPHTPWMGLQDFELDALAVQLESYHLKCRELLSLEQRCTDRLREIHLAGLTKYSNDDNEEGEIMRIIDFSRHLPQEAEALARKERVAIVNVTSSLRMLRDGLYSFTAQMHAFNRIISGRQLSDLKVFKIEPYADEPMVDAIDLLISRAEKADTGDTFELFSQQSIMDDASINRAKDLLIKEGEARGCLRVENLFRLEFVVGKGGQKEESFSDMDSAASNGTVLMAKLVTGLALLYLMQDRRHKVRAICYLDEASSLDQHNQRNLIDTAREFGFALIFASPTPQITARYCVPISTRAGVNHISRLSWQILEPLAELEAVTP